MADSVTPGRLSLDRAIPLLSRRLQQLEDRIRGGKNETLWREYLETIRTLVAVLGRGEGGQEMLTTRQMAERLGVSPKTLLRHKAAGAVRPAVQSGKLIRWRGDEVPR
jgi:hypothetical protein